MHAVVFDLDGTLLDTMVFAPRAYADTVSALGGPALSLDEVVAVWHIGPAPVLLARLLGRPVEPDDIECYYRNLEAAVSAVRPFPGVREMIGALRDAGYRLGIYTSATRRAATLMLAAAGIEEDLPATVCGDEIDDPKPDPAGLRLACQRLDVTPAETAYVGDAQGDLRCARSAGSLGIHAAWGGRPLPAGHFAFAAARPQDVVDFLRRPPPRDHRPRSGAGHDT